MRERVTAELDRRSPGARLVAIASSLVLSLCASASAESDSPSEFRIWPSKDETRAGDRPVGSVDLEQLADIEGSHAPVATGAPSGFTFVPRKSPLAALELRIGNKGDTRPGQIGLYRWRGSREATIAADPIWTDSVDLEGRDAVRVHRFRIDREVETGATYYVELRADGRGSYLIKHSDGADAYRDGELYTRDRFWPTRDAWFRTFTSGGAAPKWRPPELVVPSAGLPLHEPRAQSRPVSRRSYFQRVARFSHARRVSAWNACGARTEEFALLEAFLYRASCENGRCDEKYARGARDFYRDAFAWRACRKGSTLSTAVPAAIDGRPLRCAASCEASAEVVWNPMARATTAYLWTRDSKAYTDDDRALVRALLADLAERLWEKRELGTHNRALQYMTLYRVTSDLVPEHPRARAWRRYSDRIFDDLRRAGDMREDSSEYAAVVWWPAILEYLEVTGTRSETFREPWFRALVERAYHVMTPIGPAADFGNSVGFGRDVAGWVWLFETAAREYGEPRFREAAHRAFAFHDGWVRDRQPEVDALEQTMASLAWAYFATDDALAAAPPPPRREVPLSVATAPSAALRALAPGERLARSFVADASPLARIDLTVSVDPPQRLEIELRDESAPDRPLYRDRLASSAEGAIRAYPFVELEPGRRYAIEVRAPQGADPGAVRAGVASDGALAVSAFSLDGLGSTVTTRRPARARPREELGPPPYDTFTLEDRHVPDKLVLRSGFEPTAFHAVFNLVRAQGHGEEELGALVSLVDRGSLLLQDGPFPYWMHQLHREDESRPVVVRYAGGSASEDPVSLEVAHFRDARDATVARLAWTEPGARGARVERSVFFAKRRFLLVRDCFASAAPMEASFGSVWHATDVDPVRGARWVDAFVRSPLANVFRLRNRSRRLWIAFPEQKGTRVEAFHEDSYPAPDPACAEQVDADIVAPACRSGPPFVVAQRFAGPLGPGGDRCAETLLVPHATSTSGAELHADMRVLARTRRGVAIELGVEGDDEHGDRRRESWLFVDDPLGEGIDAVGASVRARYLLARASANLGAYVFALDAQRVRWRDVDHEWDVPVSVELGGSPSEPSGAMP